MITEARGLPKPTGCVKALALVAVLAGCDAQGYDAAPPVIVDCFLGLDGTAESLVDLREVVAISWHPGGWWADAMEFLVDGDRVEVSVPRSDYESVENEWRRCRRGVGR